MIQFKTTNILFRCGFCSVPLKTFLLCQLQLFLKRVEIFLRTGTSKPNIPGDSLAVPGEHFDLAKRGQGTLSGFDSDFGNGALHIVLAGVNTLGCGVGLEHQS